ncbi:FGGY-family carbohydrate kinase [Streptomyces sp. DH24]|uniref:FGGY-family carbohydrate kinase n=1 Tax=Streptomyces sp. DH24 TaxID=3040123 RepID=UPI00244353F8|nr:FGGY family carbohydrate kinase [Streptomyces sp. DH24]MDG9716839.1 FGGY family carbohydrate kinase [Streptomyces sp. DH24]
MAAQDTADGWLGIDLGTQSVRALVVGADGTVLGSGAAPLTGHRDGVRHEQDPDRWWQAVCAASRTALGATRGARIGGLAVCGTSGTVLLTDDTGRPLTPALMYDDGRAAAEAARAREAGLAVQDTWALPKALWLTATYGPGRITHQPDVIVTRLTGTPPPADSSHALKTGYDAEHDTWPGSALGRLGLSHARFPAVVRPGTRLGEVGASAAGATGIPAGTPVVAGMTDGCAAQLASGALRPGAWNSVLGTTLVLKGAAPAPVRDPTGVVYNHRAPDGVWLPGGASSVGAGALAARFPDADPAVMDERAAAHEPSGALAYPLVSPGERFPFRAPDATPLLLGEPADDADLWAALLQGVGLAERLCLDYLHHLGAPLDGPLTFTGGAARSAYWNQLRADILGRPARVPQQTEPALGMAVLAAYGTAGDPAATLPGTADRMVRVRTLLQPRPGRTARFAEPYARLVDALETRGWLPSPVVAHARERLHADTTG